MILALYGVNTIKGGFVRNSKKGGTDG